MHMSFQPRKLFLIQKPKFTETTRHGMHLWHKQGCKYSVNNKKKFRINIFLIFCKR